MSLPSKSTRDYTAAKRRGLDLSTAPADVQAVLNRIMHLEDENRLLRSIVEDYADHQSWRCAHPDRWPECQCGMVEALRGVGIDFENAEAER